MQACLPHPCKRMFVPLFPTAALENKVEGREPREGFPRKRTSSGPLREEGTSAEKRAGPLPVKAFVRKDRPEGGNLVRGHAGGRLPEREKRGDSKG